MKLLCFLMLLPAFLFFSPQTHAQAGWEMGGGGGIAYYFGDINTQYNLEHPGPAIQTLVRFNFNNRLVWRLSGSWMRIYANDDWSDNAFQQQRNLNVRTPILDMNTGIEFNFLEYEHSGDKAFTPYLYFGPAVYQFTPQGRNNNEWVDLRELGTEGQFYGEEYYKTQLGVAFGGGFKWAFSYYLSLNFEVSGRRLFTDYLDDVSTTYPDLGDLNSLRGPLAAKLSNPSESELVGFEGQQRGDSRNRDSYAFTSISLLYFFGDVQCPKFSLK